MATVHSLPIAGLHGGSFIIGGFAGAVGAPVPPTVSTLGSIETGAGTITGLHPTNTAVLMGPIQTPVRQSLQEVVVVSGTQTFNVDYQLTTDGGTTWYTVKQIVAGAVTVDGGAAGYTRQARIKVQAGFQWRILVYNSSASLLNISYEKRLLARGKNSN